MSCITSEEDFKSPPKKPLTLNVHPNGEKWGSIIRQNINTICKKYNNRCFTVRKHHLALASKVDELPPLSSNGMTGKMIIFHIFYLFLFVLASHLCDTAAVYQKTTLFWSHLKPIMTENIVMVLSLHYVRQQQHHQLTSSKQRHANIDLYQMTILLILVVEKFN